MTLHSNPPLQLPALWSLSSFPPSVGSQTDFPSDDTTRKGEMDKHDFTLLPSHSERRPLPAIPEPSLAPKLFGLKNAAQRNPSSSSSSSSSSPWTTTNLPHSTQPAKRMQSDQRPITRVLSSFLPRTKPSSMSLLTPVQKPAVLAALIVHLNWADTYMLFSTCKTLRESFRGQPAVRDVVLARYVPGYSQALRERDLTHYHDIPVSIHDLDLLLISQRVPLHRYPVHALRTLTSLLPTFDDDELTAKLVALTQSYSRIVLLMQSLAHSSSEQLPLEPEDFKPKSRFSSVQTLRELTFPAPLAYAQLPSPVATTGIENLLTTRARHSRSRSQPTNDRGSIITAGKNTVSGVMSPSKGAHGPRPSANSLSSMMSNNDIATLRKGRHLSFFGKTSPKLTPPPPEEPQTLKYYSKTWRRTTQNVTQESFVDEYGFMTTLQRPTRRFASANNSSDSSISELAIQRDSSSSALSSPHDFTLATSRLRAPVLRVFVPCTRLDEDDDNVALCERQLEDSGLWEHLSTGDIVCNLGYVPPTGEEGSSDGDDISRDTLPTLYPRSSRSAPSNSSGLSSPGAPAAQRKWLLFTGECLVPYTPPDILPLDTPIALPSPFYYAHIMPPAASPVYRIRRLPVCDDVPQLTLVHARTKLPSPHSPKGYALVKKYLWTARVVRLRVGDEEDVGEGWFGEWVLEYEGTKEGKQTLLDALAGRELGNRQWELVREKSGAGKLWFRLLPE